MRNPFSLLCVELFYLQFHLARQSLTALFISVLCGSCINPGSLQNQSLPSPLPSSPPSWREDPWNNIHIFEDSQTTRYANVFGIAGVRAPKTKRQQIHVKVQHVLVEYPGLAQLLKAPQLGAQVSCAVSLHMPQARNMPHNFKLSFVVLAS